MGESVVVAKRTEIEPGKSKICTIGDEQVAVFNKDGEYFAIANMCPHRGGPLGEGDMDSDGVITCPWHGWTFDVKTGNCTSMPSSVKKYEVVVDGDEVKVRIEQ